MIQTQSTTSARRLTLGYGLAHTMLVHRGCAGTGMGGCTCRAAASETASRWQRMGTDSSRTRLDPLNGRLYTCYFPAPVTLFAYDRDTLARCPEDDISLERPPDLDNPLSPTQPLAALDKVQGGVFTRNGRLILTRSGRNGMFCFSSVTGHFYGLRWLSDFGSFLSEVEGVTVWDVTVGDDAASIHVLELDNDVVNKDDCYLFSYAVPHPEWL
jgi:hypothetical protein